MRILCPLFASNFEGSTCLHVRKMDQEERIIPRLSLSSSAEGREKCAVRYRLLLWMYLLHESTTKQAFTLT